MQLEGRMKVGELVGRGRTSMVYAYGHDSVVKVPHDDIPSDWPDFEAALTRAVGAEGVRAPKVRDVVSIDGRRSVVFERIAGPSMWHQMVDRPDQAQALARELANTQRALLAVGIPPGVPELVDRLTRKIATAAPLDNDDRAEAIALVERLPRGAALLHGDLHPGNVLMSPKGPVVIDWFDATIGHPVADIVRSSILMQAGATVAPRHLPNAPEELLSKVHSTYLDQFSVELAAASPELTRWRAVIAAGRLAEGAEADEGGLLALWQSRFSPAAPAS